MKTCTFVLCQQHPSASGYFAFWETDGKCEEISSEYIRVTVAEGQYLFLNQEQPGEEYEGSSVLIRVPSDAAFAEFCEEAERQAGQKIYDRISGYAKGPRHGGQYDYTNGFDGVWLRTYAIRIWKEVDGPYPKNLHEAISFAP